MANELLNALLTRRSLKPKYLTLPFPTKDQIETAARAALRASSSSLTSSATN